MRAYLAKAIDASELQHEVKKLILDSKGTYESILELIYADYCAQETGDTLRNTPSISNITSHRATSDSDKEPSNEKSSKKFPINKGNLLPSNYYSQFK